ILQDVKRAVDVDLRKRAFGKEDVILVIVHNENGAFLMHRWSGFYDSCFNTSQRENKIPIHSLKINSDFIRAVAFRNLPASIGQMNASFPERRSSTASYVKMNSPPS